MTGMSSIRQILTSRCGHCTIVFLLFSRCLQGGNYARMILALGVVFQLHDFFFFFLEMNYQEKLR